MRRGLSALTALADRLGKFVESFGRMRAAFALFFLALSLLLTIPAAICDTQASAWMHASQEAASSLMNGQSLHSSVHHQNPRTDSPALVWPGPVAIAWGAIWNAVGVSWPSGPALAIILALLTWLIALRMHDQTAILAAPLIATHPWLSTFSQSAPNLLLSLNLILGAALLLHERKASIGRIAGASVLAFLAFSVTPSWTALLPLLPLALTEETTAPRKLFLLSATVLALLMILILRACGALPFFLQANGFDGPTIATSLNLQLSNWQELAVNPWSYPLLFLVFHGMIGLRGYHAMTRQLWFLLQAAILFVLSMHSYFSAKEMSYGFYKFPSLILLIAPAGYGFTLLLKDLRLTETQARRVLGLAFFFLMLIFGWSSLQKQLFAVIIHNG
jgi:hypothetical protein